MVVMETKGYRPCEIDLLLSIMKNKIIGNGYKLLG